VHSTLWALARRLVPLDALEAKLDTYIAEGHLPAEERERCVEVFEQMQDIHRQQDLFVDLATASTAATEAASRPMSREELEEELRHREVVMQRLHGADGAWTHPWRVCKEIVHALEENRAPLRLCLQASAGMGKSFLLETVYTWAALHGHRVEACAPTRIAAARLRLLLTPVRAYTHHLVGLSVGLQGTIDPTRPQDETTHCQAKMTLLIVARCP